jgi:4-hydroxy-tetrahydrodipicolinate synthase
LTRDTLRVMAAIRGVLTAMITPFDEAGRLDEDGARRLARHLVDHGSHGLVIGGTTGESPTLSMDEVLALLGAVRAEVGDEATIVCGTGSNDTRHAAELTMAVADAGADAALVVTPYYNKPNRAGVRAHFETVAEAAPDLPIVLYNIPSRVVVNVDPGLLAELASIANIVAVKQANDDDLGPIEGLSILAGNDNTFLRTLEFGGAGGVLVASHLVGDRMREIWDAAQAADFERARDIDVELQPVYEALTVTTNPIPVKAALEMLGLDSGRMRLPMVPADEEQRAAIRPALERAGLLAAAG